MSSTGTLLVGIVAMAVVGYLAYRVRVERRALRKKIAVLRDQDDRFIQSVEQLVLSRRLAPVTAR